jgi:hypothetical protein
VNTTPLWVPLVVAGIGLLGTIVGTVAGANLTDANLTNADLRDTRGLR